MAEDAEQVEDVGIVGVESEEVAVDRLGLGEAAGAVVFGGFDK